MSVLVKQVALAAAVAGLVGIGAARAQDQQGHWFVPSGAKAGGAPSTVDMSTKPGDEAVTIIGKRKDRSWRSKVAAQHLNDPLASDAARPRHSFETQKPYCNSTLRTVGGQPASAADMQVGAGAGGC